MHRSVVTFHYPPHTSEGRLGPRVSGEGPSLKTPHRSPYSSESLICFGFSWDDFNNYGKKVHIYLFNFSTYGSQRVRVKVSKDFFARLSAVLPVL